MISQAVLIKSDCIIERYGIEFARVVTVLNDINSVEVKMDIYSA